MIKTGLVPAVLAFIDTVITLTLLTMGTSGNDLGAQVIRSLFSILFS